MSTSPYLTIPSLCDTIILMKRINLTQQLRCRLREDQHNRLQTLADDAGLRLSTALRRIISDAIQFDSLETYSQCLESGRQTREEC